MAIAEASPSQRAEVVSTAADSYAVAFPNNVAANDLLIVIGTIFDSDGTPASVAVTDSLGNTYNTSITSSPFSLYRVFIAYAISSSGGACTVTVNPGGNASNSFASFTIDAFTGVHTTTPLDVDGGGATGTSSSPSDTLTTTVANSLLIGVMCYSQAAIVDTPIGVGSGFTHINSHSDNISDLAYAAEFKLATTATSYTVDFAITVASVPTSVTWGVHTAAFIEAGGAATRIKDVIYAGVLAKKR